MHDSSVTPRGSPSGFTLIELMIVIAVIAIITAIAIPNLLSARLNANESAAIATMKNISSCQAQCQASAAIDTNYNGAGEYGGFAELSGARPIRSSTAGAFMTPPVLSTAFGNVAANGFGGAGAVARSGYIFQMWLPDSSAAGYGENPTGGYGLTHSVDAAKSEVLWCCYAWPSSLGSSGQRAFFINQSGDVLASKNVVRRYSGPTSVPVFHAAFLGTSLEAQAAANTTGADGEMWVVVN